MSQIKKTYTLGKIKQLIDLNGDSTNFNLNFKVAAKDSSQPFNILVVDQTTLDNTPELNYKEVTKGVISGTIVADKNIYQNYFLILKSETPCQVDVEIIKKNLPKTPTKIKKELQPQSSLKDKLVNNWKIIALATVIIGIGIYVWYSSCGNPSEVQKLYSEQKTDSVAGSDYGSEAGDGSEGNDYWEGHTTPKYSAPAPSGGTTESSTRSDLLKRLRGLAPST